MTSVPGVRLYFDDVSPGDEIPGIALEITYQRVIMNAAVTWDWFAGHHDPFYAQTQGQDSVYLSTLFFTGFVDRCVTEWAGADAVIRRRKIVMSRTICPGQTATANGRVVRLREEAGPGLIDLEVEVYGDEVPSVSAEMTVELPRR